MEYENRLRILFFFQYFYFLRVTVNAHQTEKLILTSYYHFRNKRVFKITPEHVCCYKYWYAWKEPISKPTMLKNSSTKNPQQAQILVKSNTIVSISRNFMPYTLKWKIWIEENSVKMNGSFHFTSFFAWTYLNFLALCETPSGYEYFFVDTSTHIPCHSGLKMEKSNACTEVLTIIVTISIDNSKRLKTMFF